MVAPLDMKYWLPTFKKALEPFKKCMNFLYLALHLLNKHFYSHTFTREDPFTSEPAGLAWQACWVILYLSLAGGLNMLSQTLQNNGNK